MLDRATAFKVLDTISKGDFVTQEQADLMEALGITIADIKKRSDSTQEEGKEGSPFDTEVAKHMIEERITAEERRWQ
jgi:hypothetical protein